MANRFELTSSSQNPQAPTGFSTAISTPAGLVNRFEVSNTAQPSPQPAAQPHDSILDRFRTIIPTLEELGKQAAQKIKGVAEDVLAKSGPVQVAAKIQAGQPFIEAVKSTYLEPLQNRQAALRAGQLISQGVPPEEARKQAIKEQVAGLALGVVGGTGALKGIEEPLLKANTADKAKKILMGAGVAEDVASQYAPKFAAATKIEDVRSGLQSLENTLRTTKSAASAGVKAIPKELEPLAEWIRKEIDSGKIKNEDDFIRRLGFYDINDRWIFHGTSAKSADLIRRNGFAKTSLNARTGGISFTNDPATAKLFAKKYSSIFGNRTDVKDSEVGIIVVDKSNLKIAKLSDYYDKFGTEENFISWAKRNKYDGVDFDFGESDPATFGEVKIFNPQKLKILPIKNLTDFYNQVAKGIKATKPEISPKLLPPPAGQKFLATGEPIIGEGRLTGKKTAIRRLQQEKEATTLAEQGIAKITKRGVPVSQEFVDYAKKLKDLGPVEYKPTSVLDPLRAAEKLDGSQFGLIKKTLIRPVQIADDELIRDAENIKRRVAEFAGGIKSGSETDKLIRRYGERNVYPENFTAEDAAKITPEIQRAAEGFRQLYDELLDRINEARKIAGQKPVPKRRDYFTHADELGILTQIFGDLNNVPGEILRAAPFTKPNAPFFKFALPRMFHRTSVGAVEGFERYIQSALPTIHYARPLIILRAHIPYLPPRASAYFQDWANDIARKKSILDRGIPDPLLKINDMFRGLTSKGVILGNLSTAFLQPSSIASTISRAGLINTIKALPETFSNKGIEIAEKYSKVLRARTYDPEINPSTLSKPEKLLGWMIQTFDRLTVRNAFLAGLKYAINDKKLPFDEAVHFADDLAQKVQASNRIIFQPPLLRSKVGRTIGQLQTFTTNLYNQIRRDIPLIAKEESKREAIRAAAYLGASAVLINYLYRQAGLREPYDLTTFVPLAGSFRFGEPSPAFTGAAGAAQTIFGEGETREKGLKRLKKFAFSLVPGGLQASKTLQGIRAVSEGGQRTRAGNLQFEIKGLPEEARAILFGPYGTRAGQEYLEQRKKKRESQTTLNRFE
jgi:hypothetical protein